MITVATITAELVHQMPFIEEGLEQNLINLSQLARQLQPKIQQRLLKDVQLGAIMMALKRLVPSYKAHFGELQEILDQMGDIAVKSHLVGYTFMNSPTLAHRFDELISQRKTNPNRFLTLSQGIYETSLIIDAEYDSQITKLFRQEKVIVRIANISSLTIKLPPSNIHIPGVYYTILKLLAWQGINLTDVVSTANELTILMEDQYIDRAFSLLKNRANKQL